VLDTMLQIFIPLLWFAGMGFTYPLLARQAKIYDVSYAEQKCGFIAAGWPLTIWMYLGWVLHKREDETGVQELNHEQRQTLNFERQRVAIVQEASDAIERWTKVSADAEYPISTTKSERTKK
jgi:hypothetical protein